jgi:hypothetical protein
MYVRWQSRKRRRSEFGPSKGKDTHWKDTHWSAVIVESTRVSGKPVQRHVAYLAGFTDSAIKINTQRCLLWNDISARLDRLGKQITPADRHKIEATIAEKVPRPTAAEYKDSARRRAQVLGWKWLTDKERTLLRDEAELWKAAQVGPGGQRKMTPR